jgi:hypothetical protein
MFTRFLTIEAYIESIQPISLMLLSPRSFGWLRVSQHRRRVIALLSVLSIMIVPVVSCAPPSTVSPLEPSTAPVGSVNPRGMVERN